MLDMEALLAERGSHGHAGHHIRFRPYSFRLKGLQKNKTIPCLVL